DHLKIGAFHRRLEIGVGGRPSDAVLHRHAEWAKPLLPLAVEVGADRIVRLPARLDEGVVERVGFSAMRRRQRSGVAAIRVGVALKALSATKVGQYISISPPPCALLLPALEIERMSADIDHAVDRRRAAQNLAPRTGDAPAAEMRLGLGFLSPIIGIGVHGNRQRRRHLDEDRAITSAVFKQKHTRAAVFSQPIGEDAARRTGPDDYVVESLAIHPRDACSPHRFSPDYASVSSDAT